MFLARDQRNKALRTVYSYVFHYCIILILFDNGAECVEVNIADERSGETICRETVDWRIVLSIGNLVLLVLWSGSMDDGCNLVTQTVHSPRHKLHSIKTI